MGRGFLCRGLVWVVACYNGGWEEDWKSDFLPRLGRKKDILNVNLTINSNNIEFKDARALWGLSTDEAGRIIREREQGHGKRSILRIGPDGENISSFAKICVDTYRHFGRLGLGGIFGSNNLKSIVTIGDDNINIHQ